MAVALSFNPSAAVVQLSLLPMRCLPIWHSCLRWMFLHRKIVAFYLSRAHSQSCYYCCSSLRKRIVMQSVLCSLSLSIVVNKKTYGRIRDILRGVHAISFLYSRPSWSAHRGAPTHRGVPISRVFSGDSGLLEVSKVELRSFQTLLRKCTEVRQSALAFSFFSLAVALSFIPSLRLSSRWFSTALPGANSMLHMM